MVQRTGLWWVKEIADKPVTVDEIRKVIGLSQLMGVVQLPDSEHVLVE